MLGLEVEAILCAGETIGKRPPTQRCSGQARRGHREAAGRVVIHQPTIGRPRLRLPPEGPRARTTVHGDVVGSGDGQIVYFALPEDGPRVMGSPLPAMSRAEDPERVEVPLRWDARVKDPTLTWSVMTPGALYDEGAIRPEGDGYDFVWRPRQVQVQLPNYDTVDAATGEPLLTDIVVFVFFLEGTLDGEPVYDAIRVAMRGDVLLNPDALSRQDS